MAKTKIKIVTKKKENVAAILERKKYEELYKFKPFKVD